jgi:hypothetical protein
MHNLDFMPHVMFYHSWAQVSSRHRVSGAKGCLNVHPPGKIGSQSAQRAPTRLACKSSPICWYWCFYHASRFHEVSPSSWVIDDVRSFDWPMMTQVLISHLTDSVERWDIFWLAYHISCIIFQCRFCPLQLNCFIDCHPYYYDDCYMTWDVLQTWYKLTVIRVDGKAHKSPSLCLNSIHVNRSPLHICNNCHCRAPSTRRTSLPSCCRPILFVDPSNRCLEPLNTSTVSV